jgi:hypothetical protein
MTDEPAQGVIGNLINAAKGLTLVNVLILALLSAILVPVYIVYRALNDQQLLNKFMSSFEAIEDKSGCFVRHAKERGGPDLWGISSGFAFQGADRWYINVVLEQKPSSEEITTYCASLKLIADRMLERGQVQSGPVQSPETNGSERNGTVPSTGKE